MLSSPRPAPRVLLAAGIAASLICLTGSIVVVASRRAALQAGVPETLFGSLESFSWWCAGALGAAVYVMLSGVLLSAPMLRKHAIHRAFRVAAIVLASLLIPVAVHSAVELPGYGTQTFSASGPGTLSPGRLGSLAFPPHWQWPSWNGGCPVAPSNLPLQRTHCVRR